jgi:hypothetical protein
VGACCLGCSVLVTVYSDDDACEGGDGGGKVAAVAEAETAAVGLSAKGWGGDSTGELGLSSGLAMRSPPRDCERLRSPFIVSGVLGCQVTNEGGGDCGANEGTARRVEHAVVVLCGKSSGQLCRGRALGQEQEGGCRRRAGGRETSRGRNWVRLLDAMTEMLGKTLTTPNQAQLNTTAAMVSTRTGDQDRHEFDAHAATTATCAISSMSLHRISPGLCYKTCIPSCQVAHNQYDHMHRSLPPHPVPPFWPVQCLFWSPALLSCLPLDAAYTDACC